MQRESDEIWLEASLPLLITALIESGIQLTLAAQRYVNKIMSNNVPIRITGAKIFDSGVVNHRNIWWKRGIGEYSGIFEWRRCTRVRGCLIIILGCQFTITYVILNLVIGNLP